MFYQSEGDLETIDPAFVKQIIDNTNLKVAGRVNHPETAENFAKQVGTRKAVKETARVNKDLLRQMEGEMGSEREVEEFIVSPNEIRDLKIGQFVVLGKHPDNFKKIINVDYIPDPDFEDLELVKEEKQRVAEDKRLNMEELLKENSNEAGSFTNKRNNKETKDSPNSQEDKQEINETEDFKAQGDSNEGKDEVDESEAKLQEEKTDNSQEDKDIKEEQRQDNEGPQDIKGVPDSI